MAENYRLELVILIAIGLEKITTLAKYRLTHDNVIAACLICSL
jgi:hypothetical protein